MSDTGMSAGKMCDRLLKEFADGNELDYLQSGYRKFLQGQHPGQLDLIHHWGFLRPISQLSLRESVTGTATGAYADSEITVTATTAIFADGDLGEYLTVDGMGTFGPITTVTSTTVVVYAGVAADAFTTAKTIWTGGVYDLPSDFGGILDRQVYVYDSSTTPNAFTLVSPEDIFAAWSNDDFSGDPYMFAVTPNTFTSTTGQRWALLCHKRPDAARVMRYCYTSNPDMPTHAPTCYLLGGTYHDETILAMAMAAGELSTRKEQGAWAAEAQAMMIGSIRRDEELFGNVSETDSFQ